MNDPLYKIREWITSARESIAIKILGKTQMTVVETPEDNYELMKTKQKANNVVKTVKGVSPTTVFVAQADEWEKVRDQHPFEHVDNEWFESQKDLVREITRNHLGEGSVDLYQMVYHLVFHVYCGTCLGTVYEDELLTYFDYQTPAVNLRFKYGLYPVSPYYYYGRRKWYAKLKEIISDRVECCIEQQNDLVSTMIYQGMEMDDHFVDEISGLFWGGMISMTAVIVAALFHLAKDKTQVEKLRENLSLHSVYAIKEAMRMFPGAPVVIRHLKEDLQLSDHVAKKGTSVAFCPFALQNNPSYWESPKEFKLERHTHTKIIDRAYQPFGVPRDQGGRACVGAQYAMMVMPTIVEEIFRHCEVELLNHSGPLEISGYAGSWRPTETLTILMYGKEDHLNTNGE